MLWRADTEPSSKITNDLNGFVGSGRGTNLIVFEHCSSESKDLKVASVCNENHERAFEEGEEKHGQERPSSALQLLFD